MKSLEKEKARKLRKDGKSIGIIAGELGVSKSTVSLWVKDITLSPDQRKALISRPDLGRRQGFRSKRRQQMGEEEWKLHQKKRRKRNLENWRVDNPEKYVNRHIDLKTRIVEEKGGKCEICGYGNCIGAMEFHHKDPLEKDFTISSNNKSYEKMKKEAEKCSLVCANCHREIHWSKHIKKREQKIEGLKQMAK